MSYINQYKTQLLRQAKTYVFTAKALHNNGEEISYNMYLQKAKQCVKMIQEIDINDPDKTIEFVIKRAA